jgi:hypothetical protein
MFPAESYTQDSKTYLLALRSSAVALRHALGEENLSSLLILNLGRSPRPSGSSRLDILQNEIGTEN